MAIIEQPEPDAPLSQGDVLDDVKLYYSAKAWEDHAGEPKAAKSTTCIVLSRPCAITHSPHVIVAEVTKYSNEIKRDLNFDQLEKFLRKIRDGEGARDVFYLGTLPGKAGRYSARLNSLYTLQLPPDEHLRSFIDKRRIGKLHDDFVRDLHRRVFDAFVYLGFDDLGWLPDNDLDMLVEKGREEIASAEAVLQSKKAQTAVDEFSGRQTGGSLQKEKTVEEARKNVQPYLDEKQRRSQSASESKPTPSETPPPGKVG